MVIGMDNVIFISITASKFPIDQQSKARNVGLTLAMVFRIILLFGISFLISLQKPFIHFDFLRFLLH
jgi:predicted tellurium resistance membrane protein TerC